MLFQALRINPNKIIKKFEDKVEPFLTEEGNLDGKTVRTAMMIWKPELMNLIAVPDGETSLTEFVDVLSDVLLGRKV